MSILVTGGTGFIGSHTVVQMLQAGMDVVIADNFSNSKPCVLDRIEQITGKRPAFELCDLCDKDALEQVFKKHPGITGSIHFAGLKAVGESVRMPVEYYRNNLNSTMNLITLSEKYNAKRIVFSSSATVYGKPKSVPIREDFERSCTNPYGETKLIIEYLLEDVVRADPEWSAVVLRYFNPIGAHPSGLIGEDPKGIPNNLLPYVSKVANGKLPFVHVFGNDYATHDGTGVRDYIHVVDLADAHLHAVRYAESRKGIDFINLGTGTGYSVLDIIDAYSRVSGKKIPYQIEARRPGDIDECYACPDKALKVLGWKARFNLDDMCRDSDNWQSKNPDGYPEK
ncbi:MAG: UDP-glucose 4-epimerase GalE [Clostridia bacterium]|nr:UDP-glucose 4-epimerase GalE [Clostridia bacterium]MBQ7727691.1 UDP-glucose 4-epimerase GalE [Clostridia bacterium]